MAPIWHCHGVEMSYQGWASLTNANGPALTADLLIVDYDMFCGNGFTAQGKVRLLGARIGRKLILDGARLTNTDGAALVLEASQVGELLLRTAQRPCGAVDPTHAKVGVLYDDPATWPIELGLRGFVYDSLDNHKVGVRDRLRWLALHPGSYTPGNYDQLTATYRRSGQEEAARTVAVAKQWPRRSVLNPVGKLANWLLYLTVGYGYRTWLAAVWLAGFLAVGTWVFGHAYPAHMVATNAHPPAFQPLACTLDVLLPVVDLGQKKAWQAQGSAQYWAWAWTAAGWVLTTAVVAGLTRVLKRD